VHVNRHLSTERKLTLLRLRPGPKKSVFLLISLNKYTYLRYSLNNETRWLKSSASRFLEEIYLMRIRLISGDPFLSKLCREVLLGFKGREWDFGMIPSVDHDRGADLLIWDLQPEMHLPQNPDFDPRRKNIFLIGRKQVGELQRRLLPS